MALIINSNIVGLNGQRSLSRSASSIAKAFEALSSGKRINSAADDAAGLAITSRFSAQIRGINTAVRNANDGIGLINTADVALGQATDIVGRIRELSVQASNGILTSSDRASIQGEIRGLTEQLNQIGETTEFNTKNLLDGSFQDLTLQIGANAGQTATIQLGDARATALGAVAAVTGTDVNAARIVGNGDLTINGTTIRASLVADDTLSTVGQETSAIAKAAAINEASGETGVTATVNATDASAGVAVGAGNLGAGELTINGVDIGVVSDVQAGDSDGRLAAAINAVTSQTGVTAEVNGAGELQLTAEDGRNIDIDVNGGGAALAGFAADEVARGTVTLTSDEDITVGGSNSGVAGLVSTTTKVDTTNTVDDIDASSQAGAQDALAVLDSALDQLNAFRTGLGATRNRLTSTLNNLGAAAQNLAASRSRILDADFASVQADLIKAQLSQQVGIGIQAQGNSSARVVLGLLS
jgi:flagellin